MLTIDKKGAAETTVTGTGGVLGRFANLCLLCTVRYVEMRISVIRQIVKIA